MTQVKQTKTFELLAQVSLHERQQLKKSFGTIIKFIHLTFLYIVELDLVVSFVRHECDVRWFCF